MSHDLVSETGTQSITPPPPQPNQPSLESLTKVVSQNTPSLRRGIEVVIEKPTIEGSKKKGITQVTFQLPKEDKDLGFGLTNDSDKAKTVESCDAKAELFTEEEEETELLKNLINKKEKGYQKETWNIKPRNKNQMPKKSLKGGGRSRSVEYADLLPKIPTRPRTPMRSCTLNTASCASFATPKRTLFSLTLTKEEIEEDFLEMTGELPPKKPSRRPRNVMDDIFPGILLNKVKPETYKVPYPPLKGFKLLIYGIRLLHLLNIESLLFVDVRGSYTV
ncbi:hypothetical protein RIF29_33159 [Crotalaria pallida]|uniref:Uncharacterized protein n=1 Tax=Crotalaria pallida TaxID=3830 RepID=A0AAN9E814_CROPI